ncbi:MAG: peptidase M61 [Lautropia sp. SCN 66-9]|nr:MAG: peptidase M61 [Lautropia sp. SCN 66-9]
MERFPSRRSDAAGLAHRSAPAGLPRRTSNATAEPATAIAYRIRPADPHAHLFEIELRIAHPDPAGQQLALPAWIPGSYMIREFARHVVSISADSGGRELRVRKLDKHSWQVRRCDGPLTVRYRVYAWDLSVRAAHLDASHGFFNGTSVFLRVLGQERQPCDVLIEPPEGPAYAGWQVATTLPEAGAPRHGFGRYRAADYDELIDHPVEMGRFTLASFEAGGAVHEIAITGRHDTDVDRLRRDLAQVCREQIKLFEPRSQRAPVKRYLFQVMAVGDGYGGLEHRASTALICGRNDLPYRGMREAPDGYRTFLGLASHEYFHTWNVKRIKPQAFADYDLRQENYTELLWVFEGFTSYYDDLMLVRAGVITRDEYLKALASTVSGVLRGPGRALQSVAESSFDAWIKYYRQDENSPNAIVSYYTKGSLVALCLDLTLRAQSGGKASLDDVMRLMWQRYGREFFTQRRGLGEDEFPALLREATGIALDAQIKRWAYGSGDLPLAKLLAGTGVALTMKPAESGNASLGARVQTREQQLVIATAYQGQAAQRAGLSAGDTLLAVDGLRVDERTLKTLLARRRAGDKLRIHAFRRDELIECELTLDAAPATEATLKIEGRLNAGKRRLLDDWLGKEKPKPSFSRTGAARPRPDPAPA